MERQPEREARKTLAEGNGGLGKEVVEAAAAHPREWPARPGGWRARYARAVRWGGGARASARRRVAALLGAALGLVSACVLLGPRALPPDVLDELVGRAERARGLRFEAPVRAVAVGSGGLRRLLADEVDAGFGPADFARAEDVGAAVGLFPAGFDLRAALLDLQAGSVAGFYTPLRQRLVLVLDGPLDAALAAGADEVAVHELVHALQDAHTPLLAVLLGLEDQDDLAFALGALLEGDAVRAAFRDRAARGGPPAPSVSAYVEGFSAPVAPGPALPRFLRDTFLLQYPLGYALAATLDEAGGTAAIDAALADPPLSSEALLHPEAAGVGPRRALPFLALDAAALGCAVGGRELGRNTFGELGLRAFALERGASEAQAAAAAAGWDGDRALALACGDALAFAWLAQFDTERDAAEFGVLAAAALRRGEVLEREGRRVLLSGGLAPAARRELLALPETSYADLDAYLAAHPAVLARAAQLRRVAGAAGRP